MNSQIKANIKALMEECICDADLINDEIDKEHDAFRFVYVLRLCLIELNSVLKEFIDETNTD